MITKLCFIPQWYRLVHPFWPQLDPHQPQPSTEQEIIDKCAKLD